MPFVEQLCTACDRSDKLKAFFKPAVQKEEESGAQISEISFCPEIESD